MRVTKNGLDNEGAEPLFVGTVSTNVDNCDWLVVIQGADHSSLFGSERWLFGGVCPEHENHTG